MTTKRTVMNAFGKYLTYADHLAKIKRGEEDGDVADFARATKWLSFEYEDKMKKFLGHETDVSLADDND